MNSIEVMAQLVFDYRSEEIGRSRIVHADCFEWLSRIPENSIHAIVTDPPYGVKEYEFDQIEKRSNGNGVSGGFHLPLTEAHVHLFPGSQRLTAKSATPCGVSLSSGPG